MFVANLIESKEPVVKEKKGLFDLFSSKKIEPFIPQGKRQIIIEGNLIRIINDKGTIDLEITLSEEDQISMQDAYNLPRDLVEERYPALKKGIIANSINTQGQSFNFEVDSYSELRELQKYILFWKSQGMRIIETSSS